MLSSLHDKKPSWWSLLWQPELRLRFIIVALFFIGATALVWICTLHIAEHHRKAGVAIIKLRAKARVNAYGQQIEDMTDRLQRVGKALLSNWQRSPRRIDFENILVGIYPTGKPLYVIFYDEEGQVLSSSFAPRKARLLDASFLAYHRTHCCEGWHVTPVEFSPITGTSVLRLSHGLTRDDGSFAGALVFGLTPDFLSAFQDNGIIGPDDFVHLRLIDGPVLAAKVGAGQVSRSFHKAVPRFDAPQGIRREAGDGFDDGRARYLGWRKHPTMPLVAVAAISEAEAMDAVEDTIRIHFAAAIIITGFLLVLCCGGLLVLAKLAMRRKAEDEVRQVYRTATDAADEGFYMLRPLRDGAGQLTDFRFEDVNERGSLLLGSDRDHLLAQAASAVLLPAVFAELLDLIRKAEAFQVAEDEHRVGPVAKLPSKWLYRRAVRVGGAVALTLRDISEAKAHVQALQELAHRDVLTGLPNRMWLHAYLPKALQRARRAHQQLAIMFIDLDNFKIVNDTLGHDAGDHLLREVTELLRMTVRASDHVVRLGGDEFLVIIENLDELDGVDMLAGKIIDGLYQHFSPMDGPLAGVGASVGICAFPRDGEQPDALLKHADIAMYQAKALGRGQRYWYTQALSSQLDERLGSEQALRRAIEHDQLVIHYQPKFSAQTGLLTGVEALLRWQRPERGLVMPASFIALAENAGLIVPVGDWVIQRVVEQMADWQRADIVPPRVSINVSPEQLRRSDVAGFLERQLHSAGVASSLLDIEITESAMIERRPAVRKQLARLRALDVHLWIDDFGAGFSSLSQLKQLDVDGLKIDRALIAPLAHANDAEALCRAIIGMAAALNLDVVAEGVETPEQLAVLKAIHCDEVQGYLLGEPLPAQALISMLRLPPEERISPLLRAADPK